MLKCLIMGLVGGCLLWGMLPADVPATFAQPTTITVVYDPSDENFPNPERGFYDQEALMWLDEQRSWLERETLQTLRQTEGITLMRWYFVLDEFRERPLDEQTLDFIAAQFNIARLEGYKVIPRFAYNFPTSGTYPYTEPDAPLAVVLEHIAQLQPLLQAHADVIASMEIGFVGAWGEWHSSTQNLVDDEMGLNDASRAIIEALMAALPPERMLRMRYIGYRQALFGTTPLEFFQAFSQQGAARMGFHNDCFLASWDEWGGYPSDDAALREAWRIYVAQETRFVVQGGETCNDDPEFTRCANALDDLARFHYSDLNRDYHPDVLARWREEGCYAEIARRLGYRFRLIEATLPTELTLTDALRVQIVLVNEGFAAPYNPRGLELILRETNSKATYVLPIDTSDPANDPRRWLPESGPITLNWTLSLPLDLPAGTYELLLHLPDPAPTLYGKPAYSIRFANTDVWEPHTGYNHLLATVTILVIGAAS